jgi:hypothetical protein
MFKSRVKGLIKLGKAYTDLLYTDSVKAVVLRHIASTDIVSSSLVST